ncbi:beta-hydroxyacid dehydrogenase, 3-hydroxyisobutyrate dehydrogenase [Desulfitobacterium dichloroeliminans LMG P-21439]|uniref:Beta-hydroxyacid dehydrogenase, 3-hydroxyisobutyrate dehydrogenase n=1 Tax=Desulfitobacterium dichloroeliminans (strain LMG P-21439 / DCA1) TaxID=871963 RepID=L0F6N4_DESDL|nr:NAD(P)-dependent oxidoreductase [Desulfitobacterium dichloroeliminans]AGA68316.1 beta-hydroxyacid dehydrogenase, 3-hydroxyisobutyrate dehydrogenase [Desulfitobacterium dichloroeliminans LMG P-21439]
MKLGFVGLGQMGKPMALNLLKSGKELIVYDQRPNSYLEFEEQGARVAKGLQDVAEADIIFCSLPNSEVVHQVLLGEEGLKQALRTGQIIVDTSTIKYNTTLDIAKELAARGVEFLDAPVSGMEARAKEGTLTMMCGGKQELFTKVTPYLQWMANKILYMGNSGSGQLTKLINQLLFDINGAALAEILPMSIKLGLDPEKVGEVVNSGTGRSYASEFFIPKILEGNFTEGYPMKHAYKDLVSGVEISSSLCIPMPVLCAATTTYQIALLKGLGDRDKGGMIGVFEDLLQVQYRKSTGKGGLG